MCPFPAEVSDSMHAFSRLFFSLPEISFDPADEGKVLADGKEINWKELGF